MPEEDENIISITQVPVKRSRGRPRKGLKFVRETERWKPIEWRPEYTEIVALSATGISNVAISQMKNLTPQHISNILCTQEAKDLRKLINEKWIAKLTETLPQQITKVQKQAFDVIETVLSSKAVLEKNPIALLRESISILKGVGVMKSDSPVINNNNVASASGMSDSLLSTIAAALESGKRVDEKFGNLPKDVPRLNAG